MEQNTLRKQRELTDRLNRYRNEYYNYNNPSVSDEVYDRLFDELHKLEQETGIQMSNSPTVTVGYPVVGKLEKTAQYGGVSGNQQAGENQPSNPAAVAG